MADVRCPMCSKLNPEERDTCQYCDARLKPLIAGQSPAPESESPAEGTGDSSDWLSGLRDEEQSDFGSQDAEPIEDLGATDWLDRLSGKEPERPTDEYGEEIEENTLPDWFSDSGKEDTTGPEAKSVFHSDELPGMEDWFASSPGAESPEPGLFAPEDSSAGEETPSEQEPDSSLFEEQPAEEEPMAEEPAEEFITGIPEEAAPLGALFAEPSAEEAPAEDLAASISEGTTLEDWLSGLDNQGAQEEIGEGEPPSGQAEEPAPSLDWFTAGPGETSQFEWTTETTGEAALPQEEGPQAPGAEKLTLPAFSDEKEGLDEWDTDSEGSGLPAWLTEQRPEPPPTREPVEQPESTSGEPEWLARVRARQQAEQQTKDLSGEIEEEEQTAAELPDWLSTFATTDVTGLEAEAPEPIEFEAPPVVSPFTELDDESKEAFAWSSGGLGQAPSIQPQGQKKEIDDTPEWLKSLHKQQEETEAGAAPVFSEEGAAPDWLSGLGAPAGQGGSGSVPAFVLEEGEEILGEEPEPSTAAAGQGYAESIPDWLAQIRAEEGEPEAAAPEAEEGEALAPASLPTWLEAMRPVEAVAPEIFKDTSDARIESAGPLAGLRGALPAEMDFKETLKPPPYSLKMTISEDQVARLDMLKNLLAEETQPRPLPASAAISSQFLLRILIFLVFLAAGVYTLWAGPQAATQSSAAQAPAPIIDFQSRLASLLPGTPVLVAVEFEPGYSTELEASLEAVFAQLANRNAPIFTVSTSTSGAVQAQRLLEKMNARTDRQQSPYTGLKNLGYLPGGPAGLLVFAAEPAHTIPVDIQGGYPWVELDLEGQAGLASFAAVIVATDRAEAARTWIEQVGPGLNQNGVELLMVTSAQVEPLVQSYYSAQPQLVSGYISGLMGGAAYENLLGQPGAASSALDAFSGVLLVGLAAILLGGLVSLLAASFPQKSETIPTVEEKA